MVCELPVLDPPAACLQFEMKKKEREREKQIKTCENKKLTMRGSQLKAVCVFKKKVGVNSDDIIRKMIS